MIPFGARLVVERIACDLGDWEPDPNPDPAPGEGGGPRQKDGKKDYVRLFLK
jgi:hypothetical protein